jgi:hypothetical protein
LTRDRLALVRRNEGLDGRYTRLALAGLAAAVIGGVQVSSILVRVASAEDSLTVIHTLQLLFCGSLFEVGILALVNVWQRRHHNGER